MKKLLLSATMLLIAAFGMQAQTEKPCLIIEKTKKTSTISNDDATKIRHGIIQAINALERFELVDAVTIDDLGEETAKLKKEEADYVLTPTITALEFNKKTTDSKDEYTCTLNYTITISDNKEQNTLGTKTNEVTPSAFWRLKNIFSSIPETREQAITEVNLCLAEDFLPFFIEILPIEGTVNPLDYEAEKNKLKKCYVNIGSNSGAKKGYKFEIKKPTQKAGRTIYNKVGELQIEEVIDGELSYCKITKNEKELLTVMEEYAQQDEQSQNENPLKIFQIPGGIKDMITDYFKK